MGQLIPQGMQLFVLETFLVDHTKRCISALPLRIAECKVTCVHYDKDSTIRGGLLPFDEAGETDDRLYADANGWIFRSSVLARLMKQKKLAIKT